MIESPKQLAELFTLGLLRFAISLYLLYKIWQLLGLWLIPVYLLSWCLATRGFTDGGTRITMASKRRQRRRSCTSKQRYPTHGSAYAAMMSLPWGPKRNVYECKFCKGYHVGRMDKRRIQARRDKQAYW